MKTLDEGLCLKQLLIKEGLLLLWKEKQVQVSSPAGEVFL